MFTIKGKPNCHTSLMKCVCFYCYRLLKSKYKTYTALFRSLLSFNIFSYDVSSFFRFCNQKSK